MTDAIEKDPQGQKNTIIPNAIIDGLRASFPRDTLETRILDNDFKQTGVKPAYIVERLNDVLGMDGWDYEILEEETTANECMAKVVLHIYHVDPGTFQKLRLASRVQWGGCGVWGKGHIADSRKGAVTNAIGKCASMFDVAHEAYKGLLAPVEKVAETISDAEVKAAKKAPAKKAAAPVNTADLQKAKKALSNLFVEHQLGRNHLISLIEKNFGKTEIGSLDLVEVSKIHELVLEELKGKETTTA